MATPGYVESLVGGLDATVKRALTEVFRYVLPNGKFGPVEHQTKSESFQAYYVRSTTSSTTNNEFSILHGMGRTPYAAVPVMDLGSTGEQFLGLTVTRSADAQRVYLRSTSVSAPFVLLLE